MTDTPEAVRLADWLEADACDLEAPRQAAALLRRIPELEAEVQEQARLNGMGAERELALMAQVSRLEAERDGLNAARFAYASEFGLDEEGQPDVGSIHQNIRALKADRDKMRAELEKVRVPEGWKLVPVEPTREMLDRGSYHYGTMETIAKHAYKAMLTAAPTPPNADQKGQ